MEDEMTEVDAPSGAKAHDNPIGRFLAFVLGPPSKVEQPIPIQRDLRLDFFRGLSLFFIFIDHIPGNILSTVTLQSVAFCDAAEVFVFISGYTAALVYGQLLLRRGPLFATVQVYHRVWQLYVAHIFIFVIYTAEVSYATIRLRTETYSEVLRLSDFLEQPHVAIIKMLLLQYQPEFLDILPLYIVLLGLFPIVLLVQRYRPFAPLIGSFVVYLLTLYFGWQAHAYPDDEWFFNPYAWQFIFVIAATAGYARVAGLQILPQWRGMWRIAVAATAAIALVKVTWTVHMFVPVPALFFEQLGELVGDKSNLSPIRLISFLALALATVHFVTPQSAFLQRRFARPVILCGQHSLQVFCLGIILSVLGRFVVTSISSKIPVQIAVNLIGIGLMVALAYLLAWYKKTASAPARARLPAPA
jgi:hypothetical protein